MCSEPGLLRSKFFQKTLILAFEANSALSAKMRPKFRKSHIVIHEVSCRTVNTDCIYPCHFFWKYRANASWSNKIFNLNLESVWNSSFKKVEILCILCFKFNWRFLKRLANWRFHFHFSLKNKSTKKFLKFNAPCIEYKKQHCK